MLFVLSAAIVLPSCVVIDDGRRFTRRSTSPEPQKTEPTAQSAATETAATVADVNKMSVKEQDQRAEEIFSAILEMTAERDREDIIPQMEHEYMKIIDRYPDSGLAQESYMRLINMNLQDYLPPRLKQADILYQRFVTKYPNSPIKTSIDDNVMRFYHRNRLWNRLLISTSQYVRDFIDTENLRYPLFLFFFTEARFHLGDQIEAEKGYLIIKELKPGTLEARISADRLKEIEKLKAARKK